MIPKSVLHGLCLLLTVLGREVDTLKNRRLRENEEANILIALVIIIIVLIIIVFFLLGFILGL